MSSLALSCVLCGNVICGCYEHTNNGSLQGVFGVCFYCMIEISKRVGEKVGLYDEITKNIDTSQINKVDFKRVSEYLTALTGKRNPYYDRTG